MEITELLGQVENVLTVASSVRDMGDDLIETVNEAMTAKHSTAPVVEELRAVQGGLAVAIAKLEIAMRVFDSTECRAILVVDTEPGAETADTMAASMLRCYHDSCEDDLNAVRQQYVLDLRRIADLQKPPDEQSGNE